MKCWNVQYNAPNNGEILIYMHVCYASPVFIIWLAYFGDAIISSDGFRYECVACIDVGLSIIIILVQWWPKAQIQEKRQTN